MIVLCRCIMLTADKGNRDIILYGLRLLENQFEFGNAVLNNISFAALDCYVHILRYMI